MPNWLEKLRSAFGGRPPVKTPPAENSPKEKGLNEEMVSTSVEMEPKESDGLAKIFEENKEEESEPEETEGEAKQPEEKNK